MALPAEATSEKAGEVQAAVVARADGKAQPKTLKKARSSRHSRNTETSARSYKDPHQILKLTTESALKKNLEENNMLLFLVDKRADKKKIRAAVEKLYDIETKKVDTLMRPDGSKQAYVICKIDVGNKIGFF